MNKQWDYKVTRHTNHVTIERDTPNLGVEPIQFFREEVNLVKKFWDLVKQSVVVQGLVTLAFVGTVCYLYATGQEVPSTLIQFTAVVVGYFFGAKQQKVTGGK